MKENVRCRADDCLRRVHALVRGRESTGRLRDDLDVRSPHNSTPTTMDELGHSVSKPSFSDTEDDEDVEIVDLEEVAVTPLKVTHPIDHDSESSDDEDDNGRGLPASGSRRRPGHAHTCSPRLSFLVAEAELLVHRVIDVVTKVHSC